MFSGVSNSEFPICQPVQLPALSGLVCLLDALKSPDILGHPDPCSIAAFLGRSICFHFMSADMTHRHG